MKVKVTQTGFREIDPDVYIEWMQDSGDTRLWNELSDAERLAIIKECEEESGNEIVNEIDDWTTEITSA